LSCGDVFPSSRFSCTISFFSFCAFCAEPDVGVGSLLYSIHSCMNVNDVCAEGWQLAGLTRSFTVFAPTVLTMWSRNCSVNTTSSREGMARGSRGAVRRG
jgi:hypothetical protein